MGICHDSQNRIILYILKLIAVTEGVEDMGIWYSRHSNTIWHTTWHVVDGHSPFAGIGQCPLSLSLSSKVHSADLVHGGPGGLCAHTLDKKGVAGHGAAIQLRDYLHGCSILHLKRERAVGS